MSSRVQSLHIPKVKHPGPGIHGNSLYRFIHLDITAPRCVVNVNTPPDHVVVTGCFVLGVGRLVRLLGVTAEWQIVTVVVEDCSS